MAKNKIITGEGYVQFVWGDDSRTITVNPNFVYVSLFEDTLSFTLVGVPRPTGLSLFTTRYQDLELNGSTFGSAAEALSAIQDAFAKAGGTTGFEVVDELPESGRSNTFYLLRIPNPELGNIFEEYIWVENAWELVGSNSGSSIRTIYVGTSADSVDSGTCIINKVEGKKEWLNIVYVDSDGYCSMTKVNLGEFILENEFESGVTVNDDGIVYGVVDKRANNKVYTEYDASGNPVSSGDVLTVGESGFTTNNIQTAIDAKAEVIKKIIEDNELVIAAALNDLETRKAEWVSAVTSGDVVTEGGINTLSFYNRSGNTLFDIELPNAKSISGVNGVDVVSGVTTDVISGVVDGSSEAVVISYTPEGLSAATDDVLTVGEDGFKVDNIQTAIDEAIKNARLHKVIGDESTIHGEWTANEEKKLSSLVYVKKITNGLPEEVKERYQLVDAAGNNIVSSGNVSANIDIYKDSSLVEIYLGCSGDSVNEDTGVITKTECDVKEYLNYVYVNNLGKFYMTKVNLSDFINVMEYGSGVTEVSGTVIGVVDGNSEKVITLYTSSGTSAQTDNVLSVGENGFKVDNIQLGIDSKADIMRKLYHPVRADYITTSQTINFASQLNGELFDVKLSGDTELSSGSTNFVQNSAITKVIEDNEEVIAAALSDLETRKAEKLSAVTDGNVVEGTSAYTLNYKNESGDTLFSIDVPKSDGKPINEGTDIKIVSGATADTIYVSADTEINSASTRVVQSKTIYTELEKRQIKNVELKQAEYDALVSAGTVDEETLYIISDADPLDVSKFVTSGDVVENESAYTLSFSGESGDLFDIEIPKGDGKPILEGTDIKVVTGETADTIYVSADTVIDSASTRVVQSKAIAEALDTKLDKVNFLNQIYPKGSIYITESNTNPSTFIGGTWELIGGEDADKNYYPAFAINTDAAGTTIDESLPNVKANADADYWYVNSTKVNGALSAYATGTTHWGDSSGNYPYGLKFDASKGQTNADGTTYVPSTASTYQDGAQVNVNAIKLFFWKRTDDAPIAMMLETVTLERGEDILWSGNTGSGTITLNAPIDDYDQIEFTIAAEGDWWQTFVTSPQVLNSMTGNFMMAATWSSYDRFVSLSKPTGGTRFTVGGTHATLKYVKGIKDAYVSRTDITTEINSGSTDDKAASAKAVYDAFAGIEFINRYKNLSWGGSTASFTADITCEADEVPLGKGATNVQTEGGVGYAYVSTLTKLSDTSYRFTGWANGNGATQLVVNAIFVKLPTRYLNK